MLELKKTLFSIWGVLLATLLCVQLAQAQPRGARTGTTAVDTTQRSIPSLDSLRADSLVTDTLASTASDLEAEVLYSAEDSTISDIVKRQVHLYGQAKVTYGKIKLEANYIRLDWVKNEVFAQGTYDSTSKKMTGLPVFQDGPESYDTRELRYNFKTKKGFIKGVVTQQGDGNIRGENVKKDEAGNLFIRGSIYTTCTLEKPHFHINAPKIKLVDNKQVVSGPFNLVIADVPLPLGLPFGFFPFPKSKEIGTSGILFPTYGEEPNGRGFYLRDGGYYFAINEYVNAAITTQIYSTGSWGLGARSQYSKRYRYSGNFSFNFNRNRSGDVIDRLLKRGSRNDFSLLWSHSPVPRGNSSFSANMNITSNSFNQFNALETSRYISNIASSSAQYNRTFGQYARAGASVRVNQNFGTPDPITGARTGGKTDVATDFNFGINQIAPFALTGGRGRWYESFRLGMDFSGQYGITNSLTPIDTSFARLGFVIANRVDTSRLKPEVIVPFDFANLPAMLRDAQFSGRYSLPISLPNVKLFRYINLTPNIGLQGQVYTKQFRYEYLGGNRVRIDTLDRLSTEYTYSFGAGLNTRFYGTFFVRGKRLEAIRHTVIPAVSFSYTPDFSGENFGFYQRVQINERGDTRLLSRFQGVGRGVASGSSPGRASGVISYSLNNSFEMKLRSKSDTTAKQFEKVSLLDNLSVGGSYNLMADSLNLSNLVVNANARVGKNLNMNFNMNLDPYAYIPDPRSANNLSGLRINKLAITQGQGLVNLQNINLALGTSFAPKTTPKPKTSSNATEEQREFLRQNADMYVDFDIPWNINLNYNFGLSRFGLAPATLVQTLNFTGDVSLTKQWKISLSSGFDFVALQPSITQLTLYRDLHCWDMNFSWTPFAGSSFRASNYSFTLKAKSTILQDLKLTRRRSFQDRAGF